MSSSSPLTPRGQDSEKLNAQNWVDILRRQVESLKFGTVQIVVQDSKVQHIEKTEKVRYKRGEDASFGTAS